MIVSRAVNDDALDVLFRKARTHRKWRPEPVRPQMLMAAYDFLRVNPDPTEQEIREALSAVLCRCTGYQGIVRAVKAAAERMRTAG